MAGGSKVKFKCEQCKKEFNWLLNGVSDDDLQMLFCSRACQFQYKRDLCGMKPYKSIVTEELHKAFTDGVLVTREWYEAQQGQVKQLQAETESFKQRLEAAEKVCDAADEMQQECSWFGQYPNHITCQKYCADSTMCKCLKQWQEVRKCADQQQKK